MRRAWVSSTAVVGAYAVLGIVPYWSYWNVGGAMIAGKGGDPAMDAWFLAWTPHALTHGQNPLVTDWGNYPAGINAISNTGMQLLGVIGAPVTWSFGAFATTTLFFTLAFPLSAIAGYAFIREWVSWRPAMSTRLALFPGPAAAARGTRPGGPSGPSAAGRPRSSLTLAAFAGGLLYGFSPYLVAQGGSHLNLVFVPLPPLIFLALTRLALTRIARGGHISSRPPALRARLPWLRRGRRPRPIKHRGLLLGALCVAQFLISSEILASTVIIGAIGLAVAATIDREAAAQRWRDAAGEIGSALAVAAVCLAYPVYLMIAGPGHLSHPAQETRLYRGNLLAPVVPDSTMFFHTAGSARLANTFSGGTSENGLYLGLPLLVVLVIGAVLLWRRPAMKIAVVVTAAAFVLSLGSRLTIGHHLVSAVPLPAAIFDHIPLLDNTIATRYSLYVLLGAAVMLAMILEALFFRGEGSPPDLPPATHPAVTVSSSGGSRAVATRARTMLAVAVAVVALLPLLPAWPFWLHVTQPPPYFSSAVARERIPEGSVAVTYPFPSNADAYPMVWQVAAGLRYKTPGGRFVVPPTQEPLLAQVLTNLYAGNPPAQTRALRSELTAQLGAWHVGTALVQTAGARPALVLPFFTWLLARPPDSTADGISAWYGVTG